MDKTATSRFASLASQLGDEPSSAEDTKEILELRRTDGYQSKFRLGSALAAQYRFKEAIAAYESALCIQQDDWKLWYGLAEAELALGHVFDAVQWYCRCLALGADEKTVSYALGIAAYLQKDYKTAADRLETCLPCGGETMTAVLYWYSMACYRAGMKPVLLELERDHSGREAGRRTAWLLAVSVFRGETSWEQAVLQLDREQSDQNYVVGMYGLCVYLETIGQLEESSRLMSRLLARDGAWPCSAYLAAWNDCRSAESGITSKTVTEYFDRLAPNWDDDLVVDDEKINCILDAAGVKSGVRALDVACGTGVLFPFYASRNAAHVTGVDISPEMARIASEKIADDPRFEVLCGDIETLTPTGDYDCCVVYNAFPHFPDSARLIQRLSEWLKPDGRLTVAHGMSIEKLARHHAGGASRVSKKMLTTQEMTALFGGRFYVDTAISDDEKYIVSGRRLTSGEDGDK